MYENGFIKDSSILQENSRVGDLLDLSEYVSKYLLKIEGYSDKSLIALKGRFGIGKSTFLYQLERKLEDSTTIKWFEFDAWKYPDRANLWESFVLELATSVDDTSLIKVLSIIDGTQHEDKKTLLNMIYNFPGKWKNFIPGMESLKDGIEYFLKTSPAKRTFEVQNILKDFINTLSEEALYVVVEDIDRSGDSGIYFLETLNNFIKKSNISKKIKIIVPISEDSYTHKKASYHKCFDYIDNYENPEYKLDIFCKNIFIDEITGKRVSVNQTNGEEHISYTSTKEYNLALEFLEGLFRYHNNDFTLRELKLALRNANEKYKSLIQSEGEGISFLMCLLVESSKFTISGNSESVFQELQNEYASSTNCNLFYSLLNRLNYMSSNSIYEDHRKEKLDYSLPYKLKIKRFKLSEKAEKKDVYFFDGHSGFRDEESYLYIGEFYFRT